MKEGVISALGETWSTIKEASVCTGCPTFTGLNEKLGFQQEQEGCENSEPMLLSGAGTACLASLAALLPALGLPQVGRAREPLGRARWGWQ